MAGEDLSRRPALCLNAGFMVTPDDVRRMALALPSTLDDSGASGQLSFRVEGGKGFAWSFMERVRPKKPRVPNREILAVRCEIPRKEMLIEAQPHIYFDDDHYRGFPAVLVRLAEIEAGELEGLLAAGWRLMAPRRLGGLAGRRGAG